MIDLSRINWDRVMDILAAERIPDWDQELVALALEKAVKTWGPVDRSCSVISTEIYGEDPFPHKIDILLQAERIKIVDWKTKKAGKLDERWAFRLERSWQPRIYAAAIATKYGADIFPVIAEYRGITLEEKPQVKTISLVLGCNDAEKAIHYLRMNEAHRRADIAGGKIPWVQDPSGCRMFGDQYKCEFEPICWGSDFDGLINVPTGDMSRAEKAFSHSSASEYLRCPERYRLLRVLDKQDDDDAVTGAGSAFHACMEEIYTQMKLVSEETICDVHASKEVNPK